MRSFLLLVITGCFIFQSGAKAQTSGALLPFNNINGKLMFNQRWCGGIKPTEEIEAMLDSMRPLPNTTVYLARKKSGKFIYKLITDENGNFKKRMRAGKYFLYMSVNYDRRSLTNFNPKCEQWMKQSFAEVEIIDGEKKSHQVELHFGCDPCSPPRP